MATRRIKIWTRIEVAALVLLGLFAVLFGMDVYGNVVAQSEASGLQFERLRELLIQYKQLFNSEISESEFRKFIDRTQAPLTAADALKDVSWTKNCEAFILVSRKTYGLWNKSRVVITRSLDIRVEKLEQLDCVGSE